LKIRKREDKYRRTRTSKIPVTDIESISSLGVPSTGIMALSLREIYVHLREP